MGWNPQPLGEAAWGGRWLRAGELLREGELLEVFRKALQQHPAFPDFMGPFIMDIHLEGVMSSLHTRKRSSFVKVKNKIR